MKVTEVPAQTVPDGTAAIATLAGKIGFAYMWIWLEVAGLPVLQEAFAVTTQLTTSWLDGV